MTQIAKGSFVIKMQPAPAGEGAGRVAVGRMLIDKYYSGDLIGIGQGEMLSAGNPAAGSAGYVAIEHVTGTLGSRSGSFALQHCGTMHAGASHRQPRIACRIITIPATDTVHTTVRSTGTPNAYSGTYSTRAAR